MAPPTQFKDPCRVPIVPKSLIFIVAAVSDSIYLLWLTMPLDLGLTAYLFLRRWSSCKWQSIRLTED